jgi:hypothetical protein
LNLFANRKPVAICLHDGDVWRAFVFCYARGDWAVQANTELESPNAKHLPDDMLAWAREQGARRVRIVVHGDVHTLRMKLPEDAHPEEAHTAIAYEAASELDMEANLLRVSAVRADCYRLGAPGDLLLVVGHDLSIVNRYSEDCARHRLRFEGVGSLDLTALSRHTRESVTERFLLLRKHAGFLAVPAAENTEVLLRGVAFGAAPMDDPAREAELLEQSRRSFGLQSHTSLHVVTSIPLPPERVERLRVALGEDTELRIEAMDDFAPRMLKHAAWASPGGTEQGCALVGSAPRPKDPRRAGTWAGVAAIVLTAFCLGWLWKAAAADLAAVRKRQTDWAALTAARKSATDKYDGILRERNDLMQVRSVIEKARPVSPGLTLLLDVLGESMPPYTRVTMIKEIGDEIAITGKAVWPRGAALLADAMAGAMRPHGYQIEPGGLAVDDAEGERAFSYRLFLTAGRARP